MIKKLSNKEKILEMLKDNELTVKEIAERLNLKENAINVYICRLKDDNLIEKIGKKNRYNIYTAIKQVDKLQTLKIGILEFNKLMSIVKPEIPLNIDKNKIKEGIELCRTI